MNPLENERPATVVEHRAGLTTMRGNRTMAKRPLPTPEELRQLLRYEPETGKLYWRERSAGRFARHSGCASWNTKYAGKEALTAAQTGYKAGRVLYSLVLAHRAAWAIYHGVWPECQIDHINGDRTDNRIINLRDVSRRTNQRNRRLQSNNTSGFHGLSWDEKRTAWRVYVQTDSGREVVGQYRNKNEAIRAAKAAREKHGYHHNHGRK